MPPFDRPPSRPLPRQATRAPAGSVSPGGTSGLLGGLLRTEQEELEVQVIRKLVNSYFSIVKKTLLDQVPLTSPESTRA